MMMLTKTKNKKTNSNVGLFFDLSINSTKY